MVISMNSRIIVYHGSDTIIDFPKILQPNRPLDFGGGFYVTTSKEQAQSWANKVAYRNGTRFKCINSYEFRLQDALAETRLLNFETADEKWLDFICANRQGKNICNYDIVMGPVADDRVYRVVVEYENGNVDKEKALKELKIETLCNQILFHTEKALAYLKYVNTEVINNG